MTIRYITVDDRAFIYEVTDLIDIHERPTDDPGIAVACVLKRPDGTWLAASTAEVPIWTVH